MKPFVFKQAIPVRPNKADDDRADVFFFVAELPAGDVHLYIGAHSVYRIRINGEVSGYGPARAPHGFARIDAYGFHLEAQRNALEIELFHESRANYFIPKGPLFLIAEIRDDEGNVLLATGRGDDFACYRNPWRWWCGYEHSDQRFSMECYDFTKRKVNEKLSLETAVKLQYIERQSPMADLDSIIEADFISEGTIGELPRPFHDYCVKRYNPNFEPCFSSSNWRFQCVKTGFLRFSFKAKKDVLFHVIYGELQPEEGILNHNVWWGNYIVPIQMAAGQQIDFECLDVHTLQFCSVVFPPETLEVSRCSLREYAFPRHFVHNPSPENLLAKAAEETFRQCTVDVFCDCPDRERAAWLCDSFFSARSAFILTGNTLLEEVFIDNFMASPDVFLDGRKGLFPMCYPADTSDTIPQWTLWFILEIDEYMNKRNGQIDYPHICKGRILQVLEWFRAYQNADGLLEDVPGWNFIDCSEASNFASGVNYPTNLLFAKVLDAIGSWYNDAELSNDADRIRHLVRKQGMLSDRLRDSDHWQATSEAAQYYALYFAADLFSEISLENAKDTPYSCGLLMAKMMRYEILHRNGKYAELQRELNADFLPSVQRSGTFWEKLYGAVPLLEQTSCCHCFPTAIIQWL